MINRPIPIDSKPLTSDSPKTESLSEKESEAVVVTMAGSP